MFDSCVIFGCCWENDSLCVYTAAMTMLVASHCDLLVEFRREGDTCKMKLWLKMECECNKIS